MTKLNIILKSRDTIFPTKFHILKVMFFFPVIIYKCESWTIKKAEGQKFMLSNCGAGEDWQTWSNQTILKEINLECSVEGLMQKLQYFGYLMPRADPLEKTLMLGMFEGEKKRGWQRMRWLNSTTNSIEVNLSKLWDIVEHIEAWHAAVHRIPKREPNFSAEKCNVT